MAKFRENLDNGMKIIHEGEKLFELWKPIDEYPEYEVSSFGRVKRFYKNGNNKILKPGTNENGYYYVNLYKSGKPKNIKIHRLVANAFIKNPSNKRCVDHIDNNKKNNHIHNLRFATLSENQMNRKQNNNNTSGQKGISWFKRDSKWHAYIKINGNKKHIGLYDNLDDAIKARQDKAKELFGEYMNTCEK
jgi:hypothetical protein